MRTTLRILGVTGALLLSSLATARANTSNCHLRCDSGASYDFWTSGGECCAAFASLCGSYGEGTWDNPNGVTMYCLSMSDH
jgi:hypothetical protein